MKVHGGLLCINATVLSHEEETNSVLGDIHHQLWLLQTPAGLCEENRDSCLTLLGLDQLMAVVTGRHFIVF